MNRTLREEFWAFYEDEDNLEEMRAVLRKWPMRCMHPLIIPANRK